MITKADIEAFYKAVSDIDLKFPVAAISKATGESKANVSKILSKKLEPSESFLTRFYSKFPKSSKNVSNELTVNEIIESNKTLATAMLKFAEAQIVEARAKESWAEANRILAKNNEELLQMKKTTANSSKETFEAVHTKLSVLQEFLLDNLTKPKQFHSRQEAVTALNTKTNEILKGK